MKKIGLLLVLVLLFTVACGNNEKAEDTTKEETETTTEEEKTEEKPATSETVKIGATPVPHAALLELVKDDLAAEGVNIEIVEFTDYVVPNLSVEDGEIFANFFQHAPYLNSFNEEQGTHLVSIGGVHVEPIGLYSKKITSIEDLADGATIAIPNDPTNSGRALLLLESKGLIKLKDSANLTSTPLDIEENTKNLKFQEVEAAQVPRVIDDVDAAIINTNYALEANIDPQTAIVTEGKESPYVNVIVVKEGNENSEVAKKILKALQSDKVKEFIEKEYKGSIVPAF